MNKYKSKDKHEWSCPWNGLTVVDEIVPSFRALLEENFFATFPDEQLDIDERFETLLRNLEDSWFGSWKSSFLGKY